MKKTPKQPKTTSVRKTTYLFTFFTNIKTIFSILSSSQHTSPIMEENEMDTTLSFTITHMQQSTPVPQPLGITEKCPHGTGELSNVG